MADIDFDAVLTQVGERGRYQNRLYYLLCIPATLPAIFLAFNQVFVSATPNHWCKVPELESALGVEAARALAVPFTVRSDGEREYSRCEVYDVNFTQILQQTTITPDPTWNKTSCTNGWHYDRNDFDETLVSELNLVCDKAWWVATSTTCFGMGSLMGSVLFGFVGDRLGRRPAFLGMICWHIIFSISTSFATDYLTYTVLRTINALVFPAIYQIPFVLGMEIMGPNDRTYAGMMLCILFALAMVVQALITFVLRDWYSLLLFTSAPFALMIGYFWIVPESPRWLLSKGRVDEAEVIVQQIAKVNKKPIPPNFLRTFQSEQVKLTEKSSSEKSLDENVNLIDLLKRPLLRRSYLVIALVWAANGVVYSGLIYAAGNLGVSNQVTFLLGAGVELPSYLVSWWAMDKWGRRSTVIVSMMAGGIACVSSAFVPDGAVWITVILAMIGRFGISASYAVLYVFAGEILPTVVRSQAMASGSFVANVGMLAFPTIVHLAVYWRVLPLLVFGSLSVAGAIASVLLPETLGQPLPQTLDDAVALHQPSSHKLSKTNCIVNSDNV